MAKERFFGIKVSKPGITVQQASDKQLVYKDTFSTKTFYDNQNSRIVQGLLPDGQYGMWVSKPGFNATDKTAPALNNLIFNSNEDIFRIAKIETVELPFTSTTYTALDSVTFTYPHGLDFVPTILVYYTNPAFTGGVYAGPSNLFDLLGGGSGSPGFPGGFIFGNTDTSVDSINVYITIRYMFFSPNLANYIGVTNTVGPLFYTIFYLQNTLQ